MNPAATFSPTTPTSLAEPLNSLTAQDSGGLAGHPKGLTTLFFTEMWERFSYYGMRAILVLYMVAPRAQGGLEFSVEQATMIFGFYTAAVYFTALPGGLIADRILGARRAVLLGGIMIATGHYVMTINSTMLFFVGMVLIALGTGLLKPNISSMVGSLYTEKDPRRDGGFSIFYIGINLGGMFAPLVCGYLAQSIAFKGYLTNLGFNPLHSWHWGFGAAGVGMTLGMIHYLIQQQRIQHVGDKPTPLKLSDAHNNKTYPPLTKLEWQRIGAIGILFIFTIIFFAGFEQSGSSLTLFADRLVAHEIWGWQFPSAWFQSINSIFILLLAPIFSVLWLKLGKANPSSPVKFTFGLVFLGLGFLLLVPAAYLTAQGRVSPFWLVALYLIHTLGELCLSPVGLSTVTKLAPKQLVGLMMGLWFLGSSLGNFCSGWLAGYFNADSPISLVTLFGGIGLGALIAAAILLLLKGQLKRLIGSES